MTKTVLGIFSNRDEANDAVEALRKADYKPADISIVMKEGEEKEEVVESTGEHVVKGATSGAVTGGVIGGIAGLLIGIGAIAIPGVGALLIGGPLATALGLTGAAATTVSGAVTGVLAGGLVGALVGLGVPEEQAKVYEERIREGGILLAVSAKDGKEDEVLKMMEEHGATEARVISLK